MHTARLSGHGVHNDGREVEHAEQDDENRNHEWQPARRIARPRGSGRECRHGQSRSVVHVCHTNAVARVNPTIGKTTEQDHGEEPRQGSEPADDGVERPGRFVRGRLQRAADGRQEERSPRARPGVAQRRPRGAAGQHSGSSRPPVCWDWRLRRDARQSTCVSRERRPLRLASPCRCPLRRSSAHVVTQKPS